AIESIVYQATQVIKRLRSEKIKELSEARLRSTFDAIEDGYWDWDIPTGQIVTNDKWFTMLGYEPEEFIPTYEKFLKLIHPQDLAITKQQIESALKSLGFQYNVEFRLRMKSGDYKYVQSRGRVITTAGGDKPQRMVGTHSDISERKRNEEYRLLFYETQRKLLQVTTLEELESLVGNCLTNLVADGYVVLSRIDNQQKKSRVVGYYGFGKTIDELMRTFQLSNSSFDTRLDEVDEDDLKLWRSNVLSYYEKGIYGILNRKIPKRICQAIEKSLGVHHIYLIGCRIKDIDYGGFVFLTKNKLGQNREIIEALVNETAIATQRILTENESREVQARYQNIFKESPVGIVTVGTDYKFTSANNEFCRFIGYSENELKNMSFQDITHPYKNERDVDSIKQLLSGVLKVYIAVNKFFRKDGEVVIGRLLINTICDSNGVCLYLLAMVTDITREMAVETAIIENQRFLEIVLNTIPNFVFVRDDEGRYQLSNKAFADAMGTTPKEIVGLTDEDLGDRKSLAETIRLQDVEIIQSGKDWINPDTEIYFPKIGTVPV
ncbi:PAS domain S-box protein, partial [bacterium]|nr:PAS domain S-box protein [bacterium]